MRAFHWSEQREMAAALLAAGGKSDEQISLQVGVTRRTLCRWKRRPEFAARVDEYLKVYREAVRGRGIAVVERRVDALNDRWERLKRIMDERGESGEMAGVPGGGTGLIVKQTRGAGSGERFTLIEEYVLDVALLKEFREHEKQAADELGQGGGPPPGPAGAEAKAGADPEPKSYIVLGPDDL
jgi:hypothetical protein